MSMLLLEKTSVLLIVEHMSAVNKDAAFYELREFVSV